MKINKTQEKEKIIYHIAGRVDTHTAPDLQANLDEGFEKGENNLVLDFKEVDYLSSAGLRAVLYAQKKVSTVSGGCISLVNVSPGVMEVFEMTGFTDFISINPEN